MITVRHLSHSFGPHWALKDCSFSLKKGDFLFLSGPSGAGKTSLLRLLYAALPIQRGDVQVAGMRVNSIRSSQVPLLRRHVGVVFQDFKILPFRTVHENIALPLEIRGLAPQHIERRVRAVARALELESRLFMQCGILSGGEQQRVAIARAFVVNPQVLLADEPTGNLDPELSSRLLELFKQFQAYGATVVFATHSTDLMHRHPTARIMRLEEGMITYANWAGAEIFRMPDAPLPDISGRRAVRQERPAASSTDYASRQPSEAQPHTQPVRYVPGTAQQHYQGQALDLRGQQNRLQPEDPAAGGSRSAAETGLYMPKPGGGQ